MQPSRPDFVFELATPPAIEFALAGRGCEIQIGQPVAEIDLLLSAFLRGQKGDQGDPGPGAGPIQTLVGVAGSPLGGHRVVGPGNDGAYRYVGNDQPLHLLRVAGITTGAAAAGASIVVQTAGPLTEPSWSWSPDLPVFLGTNGLLTQIPPTASDGAVFVMIVGVALTETSIFVHLASPLRL